MSVNLTVICQACSARIKVHRDLVGKQVRCSKCGQVFSVPSDNAADDRYEWYYAHGGKQSGPVSRTELNRLVNSGAIGAGDLLWREGLDSWVPASSVSGLTSAPASSAAASVTVVPRDDRRPAKSASKSASPGAASVNGGPQRRSAVRQVGIEIGVPGGRLGNGGPQGRSTVHQVGIETGVPRGRLGDGGPTRGNSSTREKTVDRVVAPIRLARRRGRTGRGEPPALVWRPVSRTGSDWRRCRQCGAGEVLARCRPSSR